MWLKKITTYLVHDFMGQYLRLGLAGQFWSQLDSLMHTGSLPGSQKALLLGSG